MKDQTAQWSEIARAEMKGRDPAELTWDTLEGIPVKPLYTDDDIAGLPHIGGIPGEAPFTRGVKATI